MAESGNNSGTDRQTDSQTDIVKPVLQLCGGAERRSSEADWWSGAGEQTDSQSNRVSTNVDFAPVQSLGHQSSVHQCDWQPAALTMTSSAADTLLDSRHWCTPTANTPAPYNRTNKHRPYKHSSTLQPDKQTQTSQTLQHLTTRQTNIPTPHKQTTNTALTATPHNQITLNTSTQRQLTITTESLYTILTHRNNNVSRAGLGYGHNMWPIITYVWWDLLASETKHH